jgi:hypothetical protein
LEGGYDPEGISMAAENVVRAMLGWQASARSSSKEDLCPPQPLPSTVWKADASMGADYLMSLSPELQTDTPQHDYAFNAVRTDQLGVLAVPMRASNEFAQRPEAVLDAVRRRLNTLPAWRDQSSTSTPVRANWRQKQRNSTVCWNGLDPTLKDCSGAFLPRQRQWVRHSKKAWLSFGPDL